MLVTLYAHAATNGVHERAPKQASGPDRAKHRLFGACRGSHRADELEHVIGMDAMMDLFYRDHLQAQIAINYKDRRHRDSAFLPGIEHAPTRDHLALGVRQDLKRQRQLASNRGGAIRRVDGHRHHLRAGGTEGGIERGIVRQLAKAEWSPMAAVKHGDKHAASGQFMQAARLVVSIRKLEIRQRRF